MPIPLQPIITSAVEIATGTMMSEGKILRLTEIATLYLGIAKSCYASTGSKRVDCSVAAITFVVAIIPRPHQGPFLVACTTAARVTNELN